MGRFRNAVRALRGGPQTPRHRSIARRPMRVGAPRRSLRPVVTTMAPAPRVAPEQLKATLFLQEADGWIPAISFSGGDLSVLLVQGLWAYICATRIADDVASMPAVVQTRPPGTNLWETDPSHELNELLRKPYGPSTVEAPKPKWEWAQMMQASSIRLDFDGNAFYRKRQLFNDELLALGLIQQPVTADENQARVATQYRIVGQAKPVPVDEMVNVQLYAAGSYWNSPATIEAVSNAATIDRIAQARIKYDLEHRIAPGAVIKVAGYFTMTAEQAAHADRLIEEGFAGAMNAGKALIVGDNTTVDPPPRRDVDDLPGHRRQARDEMVSAFHVAPPVVGILHEAKYANYGESLRAHWSFGVRPRLATIYNPINTQAIEPAYGPDVRIWYELAENDIGLAALEARADVAKKFVDLGAPPRLAAERVGLGLSRWQGDGLPNRQLAVAGRESEQPPEPEPEPPQT